MAVARIDVVYSWRVLRDVYHVGYDAVGCDRRRDDIIIVISSSSNV